MRFIRGEAENGGTTTVSNAVKPRAAQIGGTVISFLVRTLLRGGTVLRFNCQRIFLAIMAGQIRVSTARKIFRTDGGTDQYFYSPVEASCACMAGQDQFQRG